MNRIILLKSRLKMPETPQKTIIPGHMLKLFAEMSDMDAVAIHAPAGYGKTTFLSSFFKNGIVEGRRVCWYSIEQEDREPQVFLAYLTEALFPASDTKWQTTLKILHECFNAGSDIHYIVSIICQEMWSYYKSGSSHADPVTLVLDDFHHVCDIPEICNAVNFLHTNLPPNCSIFISSRYDSNIFSEKQKLDRKILELSAKDLCFNENDIEELLHSNLPSSSSKNLAGEIARHTEGWIAGITIICNTLKDNDYKPMQGWPEIYGSRQALFSYFISEILKTLAPETASFLVKASLLREFTAEEAEAILDLHNSSSIADNCISKGAFIQKIQTSDALIYRFHSLFRETLAKIRTQYLSSEEIKECNLNAARCYLEKKMYGRAIEHLLVLEDTSLVNDILTRASITMDIFEDFNQLQLLFDLLPESIVSENVVLLFIKGMTYINSKFNDSFMSLTSAFEKAKHGSDFIMQLNIALALVHAYYSTNNMNGIGKLLPQIRKPEKPYTSPSAEAAVSLLEMIQFVFSDKLNSAASIYDKINPDALDRNFKWPYYMVSCMLHYRLGRLDPAISIINRALELEEIKKSPILRAQAEASLVFPLMLKKDITYLRQVVNDILSIGEQNDYDYLLGNGRLASAYVKYLDNNLEGALESLEYAIMHFTKMNNPAMSHFCKLLKYLWLSQGSNPHDFIIEAQKSLTSLKKLHAGYELFEIGQSLFGVLQRNTEDYSGAESSFLAAIASSEKKGALLVSCGAQMHLAKLYFDSGNLRGGTAHLRIAFGKASNNNYIMFWDIHYPTLVEICARSIKLSIYASYAQKLLEYHFGEAAANSFMAGLLNIEDADIENYALDFLSLRSARLENKMPRIRASLFGEFRIQSNSGSILEEAWKTKKIKGLFIYLLLNSGKAITREFLTGLFWPESDKKSASMSFRAALYELKRVLSHYGMLAADGSTIVHETATGLKINKSQNLITDIDEFINLSSRIKALPPDKRDSSYKINLLEKMLALYKGDLLEFEAYDDWVMFERERLKSIFINSALELTDEYLKKGETQKAESSLLKLLSHEPFNEEAALGLIRLYISTKQTGRAVKFYMGFKQRIENELGINIDRRIKDAMQSIIAG